MAKTMEVTSEGQHHTAANIGTMDGIKDYEFSAPGLPAPVPGKVFLRDVIKTTGLEASITCMPPKAGTPFKHKHKKNEEVYMVIKGSGEFEVDGKTIPVTEGSVVRIAPEGARSWKNTGDSPMIVLTIQVAAGSLTQCTFADGVMV